MLESRGRAEVARPLVEKCVMDLGAGTNVG